MVRINWTLQAREDLKYIAEYISHDSKNYAKLQVLRIKKRTEILRDQVFAGKKVEEVDDMKIRELIEGNYRIIYKVVSRDKIHILTVHHSSRDLSKREF